MAVVQHQPTTKATLRALCMALLGLATEGHAAGETLSFGQSMVELLLQNRLNLHLALAVAIIVFALLILQHGLKYLRQLKRQQQWAAADMMGSMTSISMVSLIQFLNLEKESGTVTLYSPSEQECGELLLLGGDLMHAWYGDENGAAAMPAILRHADGTFRFLRNSCDESLRTIFQPTLSLLLDMCRLIDEEAFMPQVGGRLHHDPS